MPMLLFADATAETTTLWEAAKIIGGPLVSAIIAGVVAYIVSIRTTRTQRRISLDIVQNKLIELALQYPHLERDDYCDGWPHTAPDPITREWQDEVERYDNYCCFVFNMIHQNWILAGCKEKRFDDILSIKEYILRHYCWWERETNNVHFYEKEFCTFVNNIIHDLRKEGKIK